MRMTHGMAVWTMVGVTALWSMAGVVTRHLEQARSFEVTFWRALFASISLLLILPYFQGKEVFYKIRRGGAALRPPPRPSTRKSR